MKKHLLLTLAAVCVWSQVVAHEEKPTETATAPLMVQFEELKWTALPERPGMQFFVLSGDPKMREYTQLRKVPAGTDNPLHSHSSELKNVIIQGVWYTGTDAASAKDFGPGSVNLDAWELGARQWLPGGKRVRLLPGRQRQVRLQACCQGTRRSVANNVVIEQQGT